MIVTAAVLNAKMQHIVLLARLAIICTKELVLLHVLTPQLPSITPAKTVHPIAIPVLAQLITAPAVPALLFFRMVHALVPVLVPTCLLIAHKLANFVAVHVRDAVSQLAIALVAISPPIILIYLTLHALLPVPSYTTLTQLL